MKDEGNASRPENAPRSVLAIDAGNTRIKWGLHDGTRWSLHDSLDTSRAQELASRFDRLPAVAAVIVSNVAGDAVRSALTAVLPSAPKTRWIKSERAQCGVRNTYEDPRTLGCDRWSALIGAWRLYGGPALVVNAGTALTVDALTNEGVFAGGFIAPGAELMRHVLDKRTAALKLQPGKFSYFPDRTGDAIMSGAINACCGSIERMARFVEAAGQPAPICVLSGGGAELLEPHLNLELKIVANLVLEGLLTIAHSELSPHSAG